jgi:hypothetical protein
VADGWWRRPFHLGIVAVAAAVWQMQPLAVVAEAPHAPQAARTWEIVPSPNPDPKINKLFAVSARSPADVWAVGTQGSLGTATLIEHWDGRAWTVVQSPNGLGDGYLSGVVAISDLDAWAVGWDQRFPGVTLTEHWDGAQWSIVPSPNAQADESVLFAVDASGPNDVWAVGHWFASNRFGTVTMHWNGAEWTLVPSLNPSPTDNELVGVAVVAPDDVWAVGWRTSPDSGQPRTLIEHWDGAAWSVVPSPNLGGAGAQNWLSSVTAVGTDDAWAVGYRFVNGIGRTLTMHWDGTTWSIVPSPNAGTIQDFLYGVSAAGPKDVWAVGNFYDGSAQQTLVEHWNGSEWKLIPSPNGSSEGSFLKGVSALGHRTIHAVGEYYSGVEERTLTERVIPG